MVALAAGSNTELLEAQRVEFGVAADQARTCAGDPDALSELAAHPDADVVLNAVVGFAGLPATIAALVNGKRLALANKESLIAGGPVVAAARARGAGEIVPVDSEHSALYQALRAGAPNEVRRLILTASGGPFRGYSREELALVTVADALKHPTWNMGAKITIDSSTLMNKGLEVIEAHELFGVDYDQVDVVVHPQSVIHGMVEFTDGATIAQMSMPDMRLPIGLALGAPDRLDEAVRRRSTGPACRSSRSSCPMSMPSRASNSPTPPAAPGAPHLRCSAGPTRSRSRPSSTAGSRGPRSPALPPRPWPRGPGTFRRSRTFWKQTEWHVNAPPPPSSA